MEVHDLTLPAEPEPALRGGREPIAGWRPRPEDLGSARFRREEGVRLAYVAGAMVKGIASEALVARMARSGLLAFFGTGGLGLGRVEAALDTLRRQLPPDAPFGMNLLCNTVRPADEEAAVGLFLDRGVRRIEASAFMTMTRSLVLYRLKGAGLDAAGEPAARNRIQAKVSRPEVARQFLSPAPERLVRRLVGEGALTEREASLSAAIPMASSICLEADSGGHTDNGNPLCLLPAMRALQRELAGGFPAADRVHLGVAGGIGTPEAVAAAFLLGADFVLTGSINQCTAEAGTSEAVKDMLASAGVQDTEMAPAGDMFELGAKVRVLRKGTLFPSRANRLYEIYRSHPSLDALDPDLRRGLEEKYFGRPLEQARRETREYVGRKDAAELRRMDENPKLEMARVFQGYFARSNRSALDGEAGQRDNYQIHCGPALGAFNAWVKGTPLEDWRARHVDGIGESLMAGACEVIGARLAALRAAAPGREYAA